MKKSTIIVKILHALLSAEQERDALTGELMACEGELLETLHALENANKQLTQPCDDGFTRVPATELVNARERIRLLEDSNVEHNKRAANAGADIKLLEANIKLLEATIKQLEARNRQHTTTIRQLGGRVAETEIDARTAPPCDMGGCA